MSEYTMRLPDVGEGVAEAEIVEWHVAVGDSIAEDDIVADVMSEKATVELPSPVGGTVTWIAGAVGDIIAVGGDFVRIHVEGGGVAAAESSAASSAESSAESQAESPAEAPTMPEPEPARMATPPVPPVADVEPRRPAAGVAAAPAVRARARALGIDLGEIQGTGPGGRVLHGDLDAVLGSVARMRADRSPDGVDEVPVTGLRRNIAERMQQSARRIPHFTYVEEIDVTAVEHLRHSLNDEHDERVRLSLLPFLMRAIVVAIRAHPAMNARFDDDAGVVRRHRAVHLGIATQTDRGLMVPVVEHAERLDLWTAASEVARLADAARSAKITLDELTGSTITITSLGALGGIVSTPIINAPEVAIVGVNKIAERVVMVDGAVTSRRMMNLSSSFDHRVIDGADAASFIQLIKQLIESPARMFIDEA